jgi:hypothetical protein
MLQLDYWRSRRLRAGDVVLIDEQPFRLTRVQERHGLEQLPMHDVARVLRNVTVTGQDIFSGVSRTKTLQPDESFLPVELTAHDYEVIGVEQDDRLVLWRSDGVDFLPTPDIDLGLQAEIAKRFRDMYGSAGEQTDILLVQVLATSGPGMSRREKVIGFKVTKES